MRTLENALDASKNRVEHFIFFSSSMVYGHFKDCIVFDEIKRQQTTIPNPSIHTPEEMQEHQDQMDYVNMLKEMREIK